MLQQAKQRAPEIGSCKTKGALMNSATGTRTRVARVRAEYPNQLDYSGFLKKVRKGVACETQAQLGAQPAHPSNKQHSERMLLAAASGHGSHLLRQAPSIAYPFLTLLLSLSPSLSLSCFLSLAPAPRPTP